jgi:hypothetical protein
MFRSTLHINQASHEFTTGKGTGMDSNPVVNPPPPCLLQWFVGLVLVPAENNHSSKSEQSSDDFVVVVLCEFVAIFARDPCVWDIWRIEKV